MKWAIVLIIILTLFTIANMTATKNGFYTHNGTHIVPIHMGVSDEK